jgi:predicted PilT family ATPase
MIGAIIGKGGSSISEIRKKSGTNIRVIDSEDPSQLERSVSITGTADGVKIAVRLIHQKIEQEKHMYRRS